MAGCWTSTTACSQLAMKAGRVVDFMNSGSRVLTDPGETLIVWAG
ncbi:hypothetical protein [Kribbella yunnanensis]